MLLLFWRNASAPTPAVETPTGGWENWRNIYKRERSRDEIRRERERLGIVPRQAKKIERLADRLADDLPAEPNQMLVEIMASEEFAKLLQAFAKRDAERRAQIAEFAAAEIMRMVIAQRDAEEEAIVALILQM
jgi:hypothetical protein